jgi:hypothetical protein
MQTFGKYATNFDHEYLVEHYIYINEKDEENQDIKISTDDLNQLLKKKRKTNAGTIFLYNPFIVPIGYKNDKTLHEQGFEFDDKFHELQFNDVLNIFSKSIRDGYRGKLIEIKYLFNLNKQNVENSSHILDEFDSDLDRYYSQQLTRYDKTLNYHDYLNIRLSGKFVFFATGHKYDKRYQEIVFYARNIAKQATKLGKEVVFMHDNNYDSDECIDLAYFLSPIASGKMREVRANTFANSFRTNPPTIKKITS